MPGTALGALTPGAVRWPLGSPAGRAPIAAAAASAEPEVPRVPIAPARQAADRHFRRGPLFCLRLAASFQPRVPGPTGPTAYPQLPGQALAAGGLGRMRRQA